MTCKNQQVKLLMKYLKTNRQIVAAVKAGMDVKTARKYMRSCALPSELQKIHNWRTRKDPFAEAWSEIEEMIKVSPNLEAKTVFEYLRNKYPGHFDEGQLRSLQRRFKAWKADNGKAKSIIFPQVHVPGRQSQSDYTDMSKLGITIDGKKFDHILFHFMLVYSRWEDVSICYSESFESLAQGYERALWRLGAVAPEHRTDNLTAATKRCGGTRVFTEKWQKVMAHYQVKPTRNNPGESHENGSVEKSHDLFKNAFDQQLMLKGSRNFKNLEEYEQFLFKFTENRNQSRREKLVEEMPKLKELPDSKWYSPEVLPARVSPSSTVHIDKIPYSVPSRLISFTLMAHIYPDKIQLYYGRKCLQTMPKATNGYAVDYRHIVDGLLRKPGAFINYQYREALFPRLCFRLAYARLVDYSKANGHKLYLQILQLAKLHGEQSVAEALNLLLEEKNLPLAEKIKELLQIPIKIPKIKINSVNLAEYDSLLSVDEVEA